MTITKAPFGITKDGRPVSLYTLANSHGISAVLTDLGAAIVQLHVPDATGETRDIVLGYDTVEEYESNPFFLGAIIGRNAGRVEGARYTLDGKEYLLTVNEGPNNLHADYDAGFHKVIWTASMNEEKNAVTFSYHSPDGECGFPGNLDVSVTYTLDEENALTLSYEGISDQRTVVNLTNHSYFNLDGHDSGPILDEVLTLRADAFTELREWSIPTGRILPVEGTVMDFRSPMRIGERIDADYAQTLLTSGYDHNWVLANEGRFERIAHVQAAHSGIGMDVYTDRPGVQFYAGNSLKRHAGKGGAVYDRRHALCLETQYFPNSINIPDFPQPVIEAGEKFCSTTSYRFSIAK